MPIYCDAEFDLNVMETGGYGCGSTADLWESDVSSFGLLSDDIVNILAEYSCELLTDHLSFSLLSVQHRSVVYRQLRSHYAGATSLLDHRYFLEYFLDWSHIRFGGGPNFVSPVVDQLSFYCKECHTLIITQSEVESPHYHGGNGPAFLAHRVFNCHHSVDEGYETQFTTGVYRVCDVTCLGCETRVGKKYIEARDYSNYFKVGKILLEQTLLTLPHCCANQFSDHYFCARDLGINSFCSSCFAQVRSGIAQAVLEMTDDLNPIRTEELLTTLITEQQATPNSPSLRKRFGHALGLIHDDVTRSVSVGARIGMLSESQNWTNSVKFIRDLITAKPDAQLSPTVLVKSMVSNCGTLSFHSAALLMSRVETLNERKAVWEGVTNNPQCFLTDDEDTLLRNTLY